MRRYEIELDGATSEFFEEISIITERRTEDVISDALTKQVEMMCVKVIQSTKAAKPYS